MTTPPPTPPPIPPPPTPPPPTPPPASPKPGTAPAGRRSRLSPRLVSVAALAVSLLVGVVAIYALGVALDARDQASDVHTQLDEGLGAEPDNPATPQPTGQSTASDSTPASPVTPEETDAPRDVLNPRATYVQVYSEEVLNPQVTDDSDAFIDLDEPRVGADFNRADIVLSVSFRSDVPVIALSEDDQSAAEAANPELTPQDCSELIRTGPLPDEVQVPAQRGTALCATTSPTNAAAQGINQRMVIIRVTALGSDGRLTLEVSAWEVPR